LSLYYNNDKGCLVLNKAEISKAIVDARIDGNMFYLDYSDGTPSLSVDMTDSLTHIVDGELKGTNLEFNYSNSTPTLTVDVVKLSTYVEKVELDANANLILNYNANNLNHNPITANLNALNNKLIRTDIRESNLYMYFANGDSYVIDLSKFNKYIDDVRINDNILRLGNNYGYVLTASLDNYDKYIKSV